MLRSANEFKDFSIGATDGDIGRVEGFYFDDWQWTVRYIIVNTGGWFNESKVLVSPYAVDGTNWNSRTIDTALTRESERAPGTALQKAVCAVPVKCAATSSFQDEIIHVTDIAVRTDDESWTIRYLAIDTLNWWPGKKVMLPPRSIASVNCATARSISK